MVGHQGQIPVVLAPGDLIDPEVDQPAQPARIEHVGRHALADRADGAPGDPGERADRGLVGLGDQPRHQVLEVSSVARSRPCERHPLDPHAMLRAAQPSASHRDPANPPAHVQVPPARVNLPRVIPMPRREPAQWTNKATTSQPHCHPQFALNHSGVAHPNTRQVKDSVE
jgi:hypothetical protein